jgi:ubiquitin carboxyl-terminal hydrolase 4/11/15
MNNINENQNISFLTNKINIDINKLENILPKNSNHGLCGSENLGNTCFMNSSIACLSNCTELTTFFLSKDYRNYLNKSNKNGLKGKLADAWYKLLKNYWKTDKDYGNPIDIKNLVAKKYKKFESSEQQDANEFITLFLELLSEDLNEIKNKKYVQLKEQRLNETDIECAKRFWEVHLNRNNSVITELFCGLNKSTITCPVCKYKSITYDPFNSISLLIPNNKQLKKIKYKNFYKDDIVSLYYIPKFSLAKTHKLNIRVNKETSFKDILLNLNNKVKDFPFEVKDFDVISVTKKEMIKKFDINDKYNDENGFNFVIEKDFYKDKEMIFIPLYIKIGDNYSAFPRGLYIYEKMTYRKMKKKIYFIVRKYIYSLNHDNKRDIEDKISEINDNYDQNEEELLIKLIEKEYHEIEKSKYSSEIIFPYKILIQPKIDSSESEIIFDGKEDNLEILKKYEITKKESEIDLLASELESSKNILIINIDTSSEFYRSSMSKKIDMCNVVESQDFLNNDYMETENITLDDCFQLFNEEEYLDKENEWLCKNCKNHVNASKKLEFFYLPKILCICLSRFKKVSSYYEKNGKYVDFPIDNLQMNKYMTFNDGKNYVYDLFGVCQHYGGTGGGHYTAICKNYDEKWYSYDDSNCSLCSGEDVCTRSAYILFYRRRDW